MTSTETPDAPEQVEPFHLITNVTPGGESEPVLPITWCVQPATKQHLIDEQIADPWLLISVVHVSETVDADPVYEEMNRYIVPLTQGMEYVRFSRPGENVIKATLVWTTDKRRGAIKRIFKSRNSSGGYAVDVLDYDGDFRESFCLERSRDLDYDAVRHQHTTELTFIVPVDAFGKPSPQFEKDYFAKFFSRRPVDECSRRKRRVLWLFFPVFLAWASLVRLVAFAGIQLVGYRDARIRSLWHPLKMDIPDVWESVNRHRDPLRWFKTKQGKWRPLPVVIFNPLSILALWGVLAFLANLSRDGGRGSHFLFSMRWYESLAWSVGIHAAVAFAILLVLVGAFIVTAVYGWLLPPTKRDERKREEARRKREREQRQKEREARDFQRSLIELDSELRTLTCDAVPKTVSITSLPKSRRTVHLRAQNFKRRVCRPFAR